MRRAAHLLLLLTLGCGAPPQMFVLQGPPEAESLEPSGVIVVGDHLWVVDDEAGFVVRFSTQLKADTPNVATGGFRLTPQPGGKHIKLEAITPFGAAGARILDIIPKRYWQCPDLAQAPAGCAVVDVPPAAVAAIDAEAPEPWKYFTLEGIAQAGDTLLFAVRSYTQDKPDGETIQWPWLVDASGRKAFGGTPWQIGYGEYALSDIAVDGDTLWMTWSWEDGAGTTRGDVRGVVARATLKDGLPVDRQWCGDFLAGKPEGIAVTADKVYVVFDQDLERKGSADGFPLAQNQDYVGVFDKADLIDTCR